jgi:hypothetical protein
LEKYSRLIKCWNEKILKFDFAKPPWDEVGWKMSFSKPPCIFSEFDTDHNQQNQTFGVKGKALFVQLQEYSSLKVAMKANLKI